MPLVYIPDNFSPCSNCNCSPCSCQPHVDNCNSCSEPDPCTPNTGCPVLLDTKCTIYNKFGGPNYLTHLALPNGSTLQTILEKIDYDLSLTSPTFSPYSTTCLNYPGFVINDLPTFISTVDNQICTINTDLNNLNNSLITGLSNLTASVDLINHPNFTDNCGIGILTTDSIKDVLIKLKNAYCSLFANISVDNSPNFLPFNSSSVSWLLAGPKNHTPTANVRKSAQSGNALQILSDGLFISSSPTGVPQVLSYTATSRTVSLSGGGGSFVLPTDQDAQTLSLNTGSKVLSISGGNTVDFTPIIPTFSQTSITPNTTNSIQLTATGTANTSITANAKISTDAGNIISIHSDGLFAPTPDPSPDEKVKASSSGVSGYLIEKIEGCTSGSVITTATYNNITDKVTVCSTVSTAGLLTEIAGTPALLTALCNMVKGCLCFKFVLLNTAGSSATYTYTDCSGTTHTGVSLGATSSVEVCGTAVTVSATTVYVFNMGYC